MIQINLDEEAIKRIIRFYYASYEPHMSPDDMAVNFQIGNQEIGATVAWEDNIKREEISTEDIPYGC